MDQGIFFFFCFFFLKKTTDWNCCRIAGGVRSVSRETFVQQQGSEALAAERGFFFLSFCRLVHDKEKKVVVVYDYKAETEEELSLRTGDVITVEDDVTLVG